MPYPLPPWIPGAPDVANQFLGGVRTGSAIAQEQQRLAQEANLTQMRLMLQQQEQERSNALEQQRLAQQQAYQTAEIGLRKQELDQAQKVNQIKIQEAARLYQAQQAFQQWMQDNPDKDPAEGILKFFPGTDAGAMTGYGTIARSLFESRQRLGPPEVTEVEGQKFMRIPERGGNYRMQAIRPSATNERRVNMKIQALQRQAAVLEKELENDPGAMVDPKTMTPEQKRFYDPYKAKKDRLDKIYNDIDELYAGADISDLNAAAPRPWEAGATGTGFRIISEDGRPYAPPGGAAAETQAPGEMPYMPAPAPQVGPARPWEQTAPVSPFGDQGATQLQVPQGVAGPAPQPMSFNPYKMTFAGAKNLANLPATYRTIAPYVQQGATNMLTLPSWLINRMSEQAKALGQ